MIGTFKRETGRCRVSLTSNFVWTVMGNVLFAACQWGVIILLAKLGTPEMVGEYTFALAVAAPLGLLANFQLRAVFVNDFEGRHTLREIIGLRILLCAVAVLAVLGISAAGRHNAETASLVLVVSGALLADAMSDSYYGICQRCERMDRIAGSLILRSAGSLAAFVALLYATKELMAAAIGVLAIRCLVLITYDASAATFELSGPHAYARESASGGRTLLERLRPEWNLRKHGALAWIALPLGALSFMNSLNTNIPRYFIERFMGPRALGIFSAVNYLPQAGLLVAVAVGVTAYPRLSALYHHGDIAGFRALAVKAGGICFAMGVAGVGLAAVAGNDMLRILYRPEYANDAGLLQWLVAGAALACPASALGCALTATSRFYVQIPLFVLVTAISAIGSLICIPRWGLHGAAFAGLASMLTQLCGTAALIHLALLRRARTSPRSDPEIPITEAMAS